MGSTGKPELLREAGWTRGLRGEANSSLSSHDRGADRKTYRVFVSRGLQQASRGSPQETVWQIFLADLSADQCHLALEWLSWVMGSCPPLQKGWIQTKAGETTGGDARCERDPCDRRRLVLLPSTSPSCDPSGPDLLGEGPGWLPCPGDRWEACSEN